MQYLSRFMRFCACYKIFICTFYAKIFSVYADFKQSLCNLYEFYANILCTFYAIFVHILSIFYVIQLQVSQFNLKFGPDSDGCSGSRDRNRKERQ
jgi:hypothetical protein